jgi:hypothetical protein
MRKAGLPSPRAKKLAVQGGEQPGFHFGCVAQLVAFSRPNAKSLLSKVTGVRFVSCEAEGELIQRLVITSHQTVKIQTLSHIATLKLRVRETSIVPAKITGNKCSSGSSYLQMGVEFSLKTFPVIAIGTIPLCPSNVTATNEVNQAI